MKCDCISGSFWGGARDNWNKLRLGGEILKCFNWEEKSLIYYLERYGWTI